MYSIGVCSTCLDGIYSKSGYCLSFKCELLCFGVDPKQFDLVPALFYNLIIVGEQSTVASPKEVSMGSGNADGRRSGECARL